jgi:HMG (high mobility group) box
MAPIPSALDDAVLSPTVDLNLMAGANPPSTGAAKNDSRRDQRGPEWLISISKRKDDDGDSVSSCSIASQKVEEFCKSPARRTYDTGIHSSLLALTEETATRARRISDVAVTNSKRRMVKPLKDDAARNQSATARQSAVVDDCTAVVPKVCSSSSSTTSSSTESAVSYATQPLAQQEKSRRCPPTTAPDANFPTETAVFTDSQGPKNDFRKAQNNARKTTKRGTSAPTSTLSVGAAKLGALEQPTLEMASDGKTGNIASRSSLARLMAVHKEISKPLLRRLMLMSIHKELSSKTTLVQEKKRTRAGRVAAIAKSAPRAPPGSQQSSSHPSLLAAHLDISEDTDADVHSERSENTERIGRRKRLRRNIPPKDYRGMDGSDDEIESDLQGGAADDDLVCLRDPAQRSDTAATLNLLPQASTRAQSSTAEKRQCVMASGGAMPSMDQAVEEMTFQSKTASLSTPRHVKETKHNDHLTHAQAMDTPKVTETQRRRRSAPPATSPPLEEPRPPPSPYRLFSHEFRPIVAADNPDMSHVEIMATVSCQWSNMNARQKKPYLDQAAVAEQEFEQQLKAWKALQKELEKREQNVSLSGPSVHIRDSAPQNSNAAAASNLDSDGVNQPSVSSPEREGSVPRPRGRPKLGCFWDETVGMWKPIREDCMGEQASLTESNMLGGVVPQGKQRSKSAPSRRIPADSSMGGMLSRATAPSPVRLKVRQRGRLFHRVPGDARKQNQMTNRTSARSGSSLFNMASTWSALIDGQRELSRRPVTGTQGRWSENSSHAPYRSKRKAATTSLARSDAAQTSWIEDPVSSATRSGKPSVGNQLPCGVTVTDGTLTPLGVSEITSARLLIRPNGPLKRNGDGTFKRPRGKSPIGRIWNDKRGGWQLLEGRFDPMTRNSNTGSPVAKNVSKAECNPKPERRKVSVCTIISNTNGTQTGGKVKTSLLPTKTRKHSGTRGVESRYTPCGRCVGCKTKANCGSCMQCMLLKESPSTPAAQYIMCMQRVCSAPVDTLVRGGGASS